MTNFNSFLEEYQSAWRRKNISNQEHGLYKGMPHPWILPAPLGRKVYGVEFVKAFLRRNTIMIPRSRFAQPSRSPP
jgi:hypothetical protein